MFPMTGCIDVTVRVPASFTDPVEHWQRLRLHVGTSDTVARLSLLDRERILPGESAQSTAAARRRDNGEQRGPLHTQDLQPAADHSGGTVLLLWASAPKASRQRVLISFLNEISSADSDRDRFAALIDYKGILSSGEALMLLGVEKMPLKAQSRAWMQRAGYM